MELTIDDPSNSDYLDKLIHIHKEKARDSYITYLVDLVSDEKDISFISYELG